MIIVYDRSDHELGRYDTASDVWDDFPDAEVKGNKAFVETA